VEFFGEKARMMGGPAALAVRTGAALMPVILFEGDHWCAHVHAEIPVPAEGDGEQQAAAMMQEVARLFEAGITAHPQDWHMLQRVFVADLDPGRLRRAAGASQR
jgi:phosphatidylinositol dimannoside acyltransferase